MRVPWGSLSPEDGVEGRRTEGGVEGRRTEGRVEGRRTEGKGRRIETDVK